jgi:acyl-coenzyme A thioesterase PaaI-like protein
VSSFKYDEVMNKPLSDAPLFESLKLTDLNGWEDAVPFPKVRSGNNYISGNPESQSIRVRYFKNAALKLFAGRAWFGPMSEGPPGHAHGGSQAALLDEGMGAVAWLAGHTVLAAKLEINFRAPLPLGTTLTMTAEIERVEGKKVFARARLKDDGGVLYSEGSGLFVVIDAEKFSRKQGKSTSSRPKTP